MSFLDVLGLTFRRSPVRLVQTCSTSLKVPELIVDGMLSA